MKLFDYGMFIDTQNLWASTVDGQLHTIQNAYGAPFRFEYPSWLEHWSAYAGDLSVAHQHALRRGEEFHDAYQRSERESLRERQYFLTSFRAQMKRNLLGSPRRWRLAHAYNKTSALKQCKDLGVRVRDLIRGDLGPSEAIDVLEELRGHNDSAASTLAEAHRPDELRTCDNCDAYHHRDDSHDLVEGGLICENCTDGFTYSECMGGYIPEREAMSVWDSQRAYERGNADDYCTRRYGANNFYEHDDGFFSDQDTYYEVAGGDDEEESPSNDGLDGYHNASRNFREVNETPGIAALGVELEVYNEDRGDIVSDLRDTFSDLILERDGSLDEAHGFEIVTQPYGPTEWAAFAPDLLKVLREGHTQGYNAPPRYKYGIHVNVHRRHFSPLAEARIMLLLCDSKNRDFVRAIAQRECIYSAAIDMASLTTPTVRNINGDRELARNNGQGKRKIMGAGRYCPVNWQHDIAEFRIFNSTLNEVSFMKNLEFVWAFIGWTKGSTGSSTCHKDFIKWVASPQQRSTYPNLMNYLSRKAFFTKGGNRIENTWLDLINKPSAEDTSELLLAA